MVSLVAFGPLAAQTVLALQGAMPRHGGFERAPAANMNVFGCPPPVYAATPMNPRRLNDSAAASPSGRWPTSPHKPALLGKSRRSRRYPGVTALRTS